MYTFIQKNRPLLIYFIIVSISAITLIPLFSHTYFSMHDDQHIARLFLLDQGINQGTLYPRWVDELGFSYGYPLFNFYPPLVYYVAELFRSVGFGLITSIKLMLLAGTALGSVGVYIFTKKIYGKAAGLVGTLLFTFFSYRALTLYVRGAFSEYFALSVVPWVFITLYNLKQKTDIKHSLYAALAISCLVFAHPFVAVPSSFFVISFIFLLYYVLPKDRRISFLKHALLAGLIGLALSAFFWLPSAVERRYTLVDTILLKELATYSIHFVYPQQLWYSPWGFGGSVAGLGDGLSFQISKPYIAVFLATLALFIHHFFNKTKEKTSEKISSITGFFLIMVMASVFLMLPASAFIWNRTSYLQYLQFPWRFMAFVGFFLALFCASSIYFIGHLTFLTKKNARKLQYITIALIFLLIFAIQTKNFRPQRYIETSDAERTNFKEIAWRISRTSFEFVPKGVKTKKTPYNTTTLAIEEEDIGDKAYTIVEGDASVELISHRFDYKRFRSDAATPFTLQLHTYNFPGWAAFIDGIRVPIKDDNDFKLIEIKVPMGKHIVAFKFLQTPIRSLAGGISLIALVYVLATLYLSLGNADSPTGGAASGKQSKK